MISLLLLLLLRTVVAPLKSRRASCRVIRSTPLVLLLLLSLITSTAHCLNALHRTLFVQTCSNATVLT